MAGDEMHSNVYVLDRDPEILRHSTGSA